MKQYLALFSTVTRQKGAHNRRYRFCFQVDGPYIRGASKGGGGGLETGILR